MKLIKYFNLLIIMMATMFSCEYIDEPDKKPAEDYVIEAWEYYLAGDKELALETFEKALVKDDKYVDAFTGLGWIEAGNNNGNLAGVYWEEGKSYDNEDSDINAALSVLYQANDQLQACVDAGLIVINNDAEYEFEYMPEINAALLHGLMASAYYALEEYSFAAQQM
ncbi:MAG: hypothetical protein KAI81_08295, partial [Candidatus Marinimicrobia bacterium]|nr:hypothetical protein [Candidatus Neomarinimicrobiota bacterium]